MSVCCKTASDLEVPAENKIEPAHAWQLETLADQNDELVERQVEYRILIGEQRDMIRSMFAFSRLLMARAHETLARADQILDCNSSAKAALDRSRSKCQA